MITIMFTIKYDENAKFEASKGYFYFVVKCFVNTPFVVNDIGVIIENKTATHVGIEISNKRSSA